MRPLSDIIIISESGLRRSHRSHLGSFAPKLLALRFLGASRSSRSHLRAFILHRWRKGIVRPSLYWRRHGRCWLRSVSFDCRVHRSSVDRRKWRPPTLPLWIFSVSGKQQSFSLYSWRLSICYPTTATTLKVFQRTTFLQMQIKTTRRLLEHYRTKERCVWSTIILMVLVFNLQALKFYNWVATSSMSSIFRPISCSDHLWTVKLFSSQ